MELSSTYILTLKFKMSVMDGLSKKMWGFLINALYKFSGIHYLFMNNNEITIFYNFIVINWYINIIAPREVRCFSAQYGRDPVRLVTLC